MYKMFERRYCPDYYQVTFYVEYDESFDRRIFIKFNFKKNLVYIFNLKWELSEENIYDIIYILEFLRRYVSRKNGNDIKERLMKIDTDILYFKLKLYQLEMRKMYRVNINLKNIKHPNS